MTDHDGGARTKEEVQCAPRGQKQSYVRFEDRRLPEKVCRSNFPTASRALSSHPVDRADDDSFRIR